MSHQPKNTPVRVEVIQFPGDAERWALVKKYMELRNTVFLQKKNCSLFSYQGQEYEQYDSLAATYIIASRDDEVIGGARLIRTDAKNGIYSYMINDACRGLLAGMPHNLRWDGDHPRDAQTWELTRLVSIEGAGVGARILNKCNDFLKGEGAEKCLFLGPPAFLRMATMLGYAPHAVGPIAQNDDGAFVAFECAVV